jgi:hypothetical protein
MSEEDEVDRKGRAWFWIIYSVGWIAWVVWFAWRELGK